MKYYAFEPDYSICASIKIIRMDNIFDSGLSNKNGTSKFYLDNDGGNSSFYDFGTQNTPVLVL